MRLEKEGRKKGEREDERDSWGQPGSFQPADTEQDTQKERENVLRQTVKWNRFI